MKIIKKVNAPKIVNQGYEITKAIMFENDSGFVLGENLKLSTSFVTWRVFDGIGGPRGYHWGHYYDDREKAIDDLSARALEYHAEYGVPIKETHIIRESIFEQMKEGAEQAAKNNATRSAPSKKPEKDRC